ncbi:hypothetical protein BEN49_02015 [Hymenobacter coccineus]|uniref:Uncharacterized protein n=2 Tax=Hymenobacter coccineus TaxID=1908235 RepID=A0A1G1SY66_9BACT|nr:hypothetical protein BEN49_02015 [Hymenobacter coccineus]
MMKKAWPTTVAAGQLLCFDDEIILAIDSQPTSYPLDPTTAVFLTYQGFKGEPLAPRTRASGTDNFIQINDGPTYQFAVLTEQAQQTLRTELHHWYLRRVKVKEHRRDGPTFLLYRDLSYEQIQEYKREFGVSLYG